MQEVNAIILDIVVKIEAFQGLGFQIASLSVSFSDLHSGRLHFMKIIINKFCHSGHETAKKNKVKVAKKNVSSSQPLFYDLSVLTFFVSVSYRLDNYIIMVIFSIRNAIEIRRDFDQVWFIVTITNSCDNMEMKIFWS